MNLITLSSARLRVEIEAPGAYSGTRWDWTGRISQVTLDGRDTFCTSESLSPGQGDGGIGLCNEWGIFRPVGFDEAQPGEQFPKLGVGLLTRPDREPYAFLKPYVADPFEMMVDASESQVLVECQPRLCRGYAAHLSQSVSVESNRLSIAYSIRNQGTRAISTHEYRHNFLSINGIAPGPRYLLELAPGLEMGSRPPGLEQDGRAVRWNRAVEQSFLCEAPNTAGEGATGVAWKLSDEDGRSVSESVDARIARLHLWCAAHVLSPEVFVDVDVEPGQSQSWTRTFEFA